jgi:hypothetical protein
MSVYVIEEGVKNQESELAPIVYRTFDQVKTYITAKSAEEGWEIVDNNSKPEPDFKEDNVNRYTDGRARSAEQPVGKTYIWGLLDDGEVRIIIHKLKLGSNGGGRKTARTIRMKKGEYLREHHHLFKVLSHPTKKKLLDELMAQQKELKERGLKGGKTRRSRK